MAKTKKKTKSRRSTTHVKHKSINKAAGKSNISFSRYIYAVLKQIHSDLEISQKSITIMNSFVHDIFERIANEGSSLVRLDNRKTMTEWDIQSAVRLVIKGGELTKHAIHEGTKAVVTINVGQGLNVTRDSLMNMSFNRSVF